MRRVKLKRLAGAVTVLVLPVNSSRPNCHTLFAEQPLQKWWMDANADSTVPRERPA